jgi:2-oxoglutarate ferredoxin oxidoreductase subunit alpha
VAARRQAEAPDITYIGVPLAEMCNAQFKGVRERILMKNIAYAGALAALIGMDTEIIAALTKEKYAAKKALLDSNEQAIALGYDYVKAHFECPLPIHLEKMDATKDSILIDGNTAAALGAVFAGATVGAWYPITPATSVMEAFKSFCMKYRRDPETKQKKFAILQAEDELAALGMVVGASWAGARAFTPTAGPGISLMNEFIGLAYYAEIPAVIVDVQRTGPVDRHADAHAAGRPDDVRLRVARRHAPHLPLSRGSARGVRVCRQGVRSGRAVPDADVPRLRSRHRHERLDGAEAQLGRQLQARSRQGAVGRGSREGEELLALLRSRRRRHSAALAAGRASKGAYFTRGSGHNKYGAYTEDADEYQEVLDRLQRKIQGATKAVPQPIIKNTPGAKLGLVTVGGCHAACVEAMDLLAKDGIALNYMRVRGFPFGDEVRQFLESNDVNFIVEQNRDAQLRSLIMLDLGVHIEKLHSVRYYAGFPMSAHHVISGVKAKLEKVA